CVVSSSFYDASRTTEFPNLSLHDALPILDDAAAQPALHGHHPGQAAGGAGRLGAGAGPGGAERLRGPAPHRPGAPARHRLTARRPPPAAGSGAEKGRGMRREKPNAGKVSSCSNSRSRFVQGIRNPGKIRSRVQKASGGFCPTVEDGGPPGRTPSPSPGERPAGQGPRPTPSRV